MEESGKLIAESIIEQSEDEEENTDRKGMKATEQTTKTMFFLPFPKLTLNRIPLVSQRSKSKQKQKKTQPKTVTSIRNLMKKGKIPLS